MVYPSSSTSGLNTAAFFLSTTLAVGTVASVFAAVSTTSTVAAVAAGFFAVTCGGGAIASITAWTVSNSTDKYFENFKGHAGIAIGGLYQFVAHTLLQALIQGLADGIRQAISRKVSGERRYA